MPRAPARPSPAGSPREAFQLLRGLAGINLVGMDLVEVCPALDHADITLHLGAHLLFEGLALLATRKVRHSATSATSRADDG